MLPIFPSHHWALIILIIVNFIVVYNYIESVERAIEVYKIENEEKKTSNKIVVSNH